MMLSLPSKVIVAAIASEVLACTAVHQTESDFSNAPIHGHCAINSHRCITTRSLLWCRPTTSLSALLFNPTTTWIRQKLSFMMLTINFLVVFHTMDFVMSFVFCCFFSPSNLLIVLLHHQMVLWSNTLFINDMFNKTYTFFNWYA